MASPRDRIEADLKEAMKARDKRRVSTLRLLLSDLMNAGIEAGGDVDETAFLGIVQRAVKQRRDSAKQYREGGRPELAEAEEAEEEILAEYLPEPASEEEVRAAVEELVDEEGLSGPGDIGRIMQALVPRFKGRFEGGELQRIAREVLGS